MLVFGFAHVLHLEFQTSAVCCTKSSTLLFIQRFLTWPYESFSLNDLCYIPVPGGLDAQEFLGLISKLSPKSDLCAPWICPHRYCGTFSFRVHHDIYASCVYFGPSFGSATS